jgi:hypothetical protein
VTAPANAADIVAQRIAVEMESRGWSQERLAKEMTAAGHPMHQQTISRILNPRPDGKRRKLSLDEAVSIAKLFAITMNDLVSSEVGADPYRAGWRDGYAAAASAVDAALAAARSTGGDQ